MSVAAESMNGVGSLSRMMAEHRNGYALQADFYRSEAIYARDIERVIARQWLYAGHVSSIPNPGDYFLYEVASESVIIVRAEDATIRAHANVCRHRGSRVCLNRCGTARTFVCRYHGWTYDLNGELRSRRHMDDDFDQRDFALKSVRCVVFHGLIFVNLSEDADDFVERLRDIDPYLRPFDLEHTKVAERIDYEVEANWKLAVENFLECYHCGPAHPEYARRHTRTQPAEESLELQCELAKRSDKCGLKVGTHSELDVFYDRHPLYEGFISGSEDGARVAPLLGSLTDYDAGASDLAMGVLNYGLVYSDHAVIYAFRPLDVQRCSMEITWLVRADAVEGVDYDRARLIWLWDVTTEADKRIINNNQLGVNSRFYSPGRLSKMETYVAKFYDWYLAALAG